MKSAQVSVDWAKVCFHLYLCDSILTLGYKQNQAHSWQVSRGHSYAFRMHLNLSAILKHVTYLLWMSLGLYVATDITNFPSPNLRLVILFYMWNFSSTICGYCSAPQNYVAILVREIPLRC